MLYILKQQHRNDKEQPLVVKSNGYHSKYKGVAYDYKDAEGHWKRASMPSSCFYDIYELITAEMVEKWFLKSNPLLASTNT